MSINTDQYIGKQLGEAVDKADLATVKDICESEGFDVNATLIEWYGGRCTVLYYAVRRNKGDIARYLLTLQQVDVTVLHTTTRYSPLHMAVSNNNSELVALLLERGAELYQQDVAGYSPLTYAAMFGKREVGELLVSGPVTALLVATEEQSTLAATKELLKMYETTSARHRAAVTTFIVETEMEKILGKLLKNSRPETLSSELREASLCLLGYTVGEELESAARDGNLTAVAEICKSQGFHELAATQQLLQVYEAIKAEYTATISNLTDEVSSYIAEIVQQGQSM